MLPTTTDPEKSYDLVPPDPGAWVEALGLQMTINGLDAPSGNRSTVIHPGTNSPIATYPEADFDHLERAVSAAAAAFPKWSARTWEERREALMRFADLLETAQQDLAVILACESGRPMRWTHMEIAYSVIYVRILAALELPPRDLSVSGLRVELKRKALGVVGAIAPWNDVVRLTGW